MCALKIIKLLKMCLKLVQCIIITYSVCLVHYALVWNLSIRFIFYHHNSCHNFWYFYSHRNRSEFDEFREKHRCFDLALFCLSPENKLRKFCTLLLTAQIQWVNQSRDIIVIWPVGLLNKNWLKGSCGYCLKLELSSW